MISAIRASMERCYLMNNGSYLNCHYNASALPDTLDIDGSAGPGSHFSYRIPTFCGSGFVVIAKRNTVDGGDNFSKIFMGYRSAVTAHPTSGGGSFHCGLVGYENRVMWAATNTYKGFIPK